MSTNLFSAVMKTSRQGIGVLTPWKNPDGLVTDFIWREVNSPLNELVGHDLSGKRLSETLNLNTDHATLETFLQVYQSKTDVRDLVVTNDGASSKINLSLSCVSDTLLVIAEKVESDEIPGQSDLLQAVMNAPNVGIVVFKAVRDKTNKIIDFEYQLYNRKNVYSSGGRNFHGQRLFEVRPGAREYLQNLVRVVEEGVPETYEVRVQNGNGTRWIRNTNTKYGDGFINVWEDITDKKNIQATLEEERTRMNLAEALGHVGSFEWNITTNKIYWSDELYRIHGLQPQSEEITMDRILQLVHPDDVALFKHKIKRGLRHEGIIRFTHRLLLPNGTIKYITRTFESFADEKDNIVRMNGNVQDITEMRHHEIALKEANKKLVHQIKESEKREASLRNFERIVNTSHDSIISADLDGKIIQWSKAAERFYGYTADEVMGKSIEILVPDKGRRQLLRLIERVRHGETFNDIEATRHAKGEREVHVLVNLFPLRDEKGSVIATCGITKDITERKRAERQLVESSRRFEAAINLSPNILSIFKSIRDANNVIKDFYVEWVSQSGIETAGRNSTGLNLLQEYPYIRELGLFEVFKKVAEEGSPADVETYYEEEYFKGWVRWRAVKLEDGLFISAEDVTDRRRKEDEIRSQSHFIKSIMDTMWDIVSVVEHPSLHIEFINHAAHAIFGVDPGILKNQTPEDRFKLLYHPDDLRAVNQYYARFDALADNEQNEMVCRARSNNNQWIWLLIRGRVFKRDTAGAVTHSIHISENITARKETELKLKYTNDLLEAVFDSTSNAVGVYRPVYGESGNIIDYEVLMVNHAVIQLTAGRNPAGDRYLNTFPLAGENMIAVFNTVMHTGEPLDFEGEYNVDDRNITYRIIAKRVSDMLIVTGEEITQRKRAERELKESKNLLQSVFNGVQSSITVYRILYNDSGDPEDFEILMFNDFAYRTSRSDTSILGKKMTSVFPSAISSGVFQKFLDVAANGQSIKFETLYDGDATSHWLHFSVNKLDDLLVVITEDTTDRRKAEEDKWRHAQILQQTEAVAGIGTWEYSVDKDLFLWSEGMYRLYDIPPETTITTETYRQAVVEDDRSVAEKIIQYLRSDRQDFEEIIRIKAGGTKTLKVSCKKLGEKRLIGVELDISAIVSSEKALKDQAHFINQIATTMPDIVTVVNLETRKIEYVNMSALNDRVMTEDLLNKTEDQLLRLIHKDDVYELDNFFKRFYDLSDQETTTIEFRSLDSRGGWSWNRGRGRVFKRDDQGVATHCVCVIQNITEQKTADKALQENKELLQSVFNSTTNTIAVLRPVATEKTNIEDFEIVMANKPLPFVAGDPVGLRVGEVYGSQSDSESADRLIEKLKRVLETGEAAEYDQVVSHGATHWLHSVAVKLEDEIVITQQDITESVESRMSLEQLNKSLKQKNVELNNRNQELANFAFIASHDLREPLRKILVFSNYLVEKESENLSLQGREYCLKIIRSIDRMNALIDDVLEYSRSTSDPKRKYADVDLNEVLSTVMADISEYINEHDATVDAEDLPVIKGNPLQLSQLLQNLITNGIKFHRKDVKPYIMIRSNVILGKHILSPAADPAMRYMKIDVADNGIGFDPKFEDKIFQMFQRLHDISDFPGTGMGLAICKRVMENHRGFITAKGYPGTGAVFSCYFPLRKTKNPM